MNRHMDDYLRHLIKEADPASTLPPLSGHQLARLTEEAMNTDLDAKTSGTWRTKGVGRTVLVSALGVAAATAIALAVPAITGTDDGAVTALRQVPSGGPAAMCATVTPAAIASADQAFRARVTSVEAGTVKLTVTDRFAGTVEDTVEVGQGDGAGVDGEPLMFDSGSTYLLVVRGGVIATCGASGVDSPELADVYKTAFPN